MAKHAIIHRMVMDKHICPWGLKALDLLKREGFTVDDKWLRTRAETDAFKAEHGVKTTPQIFIDGRRSAVTTICANSSASLCAIRMR